MAIDPGTLIPLLAEIGQNLKILRFGPAPVEPAQPMSFRIVPSTPELTVIDPDRVARQLTLNLTGSITGTLTGQLPIAVDVPVSVSIVWSLFRYQKKPVITPEEPLPRPRTARRRPAPEVAPSHLAAGAGQWERFPLVIDLDFAAPDGLAAPEASFIFAIVGEATGEEPFPSVRIGVAARVHLSVDGIGPDPIDLPELVLFVSAIQIPTILLLCRHPDFNAGYLAGSAALLVVPDDSPIYSLIQLDGYVRTLRKTLAPLSHIARFALLLAGLHKLNAALEASPVVAFRAADKIDNLSRIVFYRLKQAYDFGFTDTRDDIEADENMSSMLVIGAPRRRVSCFTENNSTGDHLLVRVGGECFVSFPTLHQVPPQPNPASTIEPLATVDVSRNRSFGNAIRSIDFAWR